ncbi:hypothetical protein T265_03692 [Opisthorchis viverrini]|uniref:Uncharacterized protein n=1 Tax=Opisthorchis viverrini TaxID=6198 RepID=A0A074ZQU4_OPIVI|nr:hypothetical protein T265_03692 [Opisthorchis viverrini]KER29783.1 hypothetical protein T265_03692 [Opisthorchis viverrini]
MRIQDVEPQGSVVYKVPHDFPGARWPKWLEREFTDRKVHGSNPTSASRLPLSRLGQPGSIPALVLPSGGMAARHRKAVAPLRCLAALPHEGGTRAGILPGCPSLGRGRARTMDFSVVRLWLVNLDFALVGSREVKKSKSFSSNTLSVPSCHTIRTKHEGWDTVRLPKPGQRKSRGRESGSTMDLPFTSVTKTTLFLVDDALTCTDLPCIAYDSGQTCYLRISLCVNVHSFFKCLV